MLRREPNYGNPARETQLQEGLVLVHIEKVHATIPTLFWAHGDSCDYRLLPLPRPRRICKAFSRSLEVWALVLKIHALKGNKRGVRVNAFLTL